MSKPAKKPTIADLQQQVGELTEALQRERADSLNIRRRAEEERSQMATFFKANLVRELLPVIDNFERALKQVPKDLESNDYVKGVQGIARQFEKTLEQIGVERIKTIGEVFDPKYHEAVSMEDGAGEVGVVCEELQPGYKLGDEVIRHAMVKVKMQSSSKLDSEAEGDK